jgi:hypothetical protein
MRYTDEFALLSTFAPSLDEQFGRSRTSLSSAPIVLALSGRAAAEMRVLFVIVHTPEEDSQPLGMETEGAVQSRAGEGARRLTSVRYFERINCITWTTVGRISGMDMHRNASRSLDGGDVYAPNPFASKWSGSLGSAWVRKIPPSRGRMFEIGSRHVLRGQYAATAPVVP